MKGSLMQLNIKCQASLNHNGLAALYTQRMSTGARLRQLRQKNELTQDEVGEICEVTKGMVSQWESDIVKPPIDRMLMLRNKHHFKLDWLYCEEGNYRPDVEALYAVAEKLPIYAVAELTKEGNSFAKYIEASKQDQAKHHTQ
jgi:transcriptional regulator with XRE-family HTH domain